MARRPTSDVMRRECRDWPALRASSTDLTCVLLCQFLELAWPAAARFLDFSRRHARRSSLACALPSSLPTTTLPLSLVNRRETSSHCAARLFPPLFSRPGPARVSRGECGRTSWTSSCVFAISPAEVCLLSKSTYRAFKTLVSLSFHTS